MDAEHWDSLSVAELVLTSCSLGHLVKSKLFQFLIGLFEEVHA
jgi:hypothetical protein